MLHEFLLKINLFQLQYVPQPISKPRRLLLPSTTTPWPSTTSWANSRHYSIMYNVKGANTNQDFQHQSNIVMLPPSGPQQQYRFQAPSQPQPQFIYVQSPPQNSKCHAGIPIPAQIHASQTPVSLNHR